MRMYSPSENQKRDCCDMNPASRMDRTLVEFDSGPAENQIITNYLIQLKFSWGAQRPKSIVAEFDKMLLDLRTVPVQFYSIFDPSG